MIFNKNNLVTVKIRRKKYPGIIERVIYSNNENIKDIYFIRYELDKSGNKTTGYFDACELKPRAVKIQSTMKLEKREMVEIKCRKCNGKFCVENEKPYGYCPYCMNKTFDFLRTIGVF